MRRAISFLSFPALIVAVMLVSTSISGPAIAASGPAELAAKQKTLAPARPRTAPPKAARKRRSTRKIRTAAKWSPAARRRAQQRCKQLLGGLDVVVEPILPIKRYACGDAAPVKLIAIGSNPRVTLSPAPIVNCQMVAAMHKWLIRDLQPLARKYLKSPLSKLGIMSSYSCRTAYGKRGNKLSQHARANALDIRSFHTEAGTRTALLANWGPRRPYRGPYRTRSRKVITVHNAPAATPGALISERLRSRRLKRRRAASGITGWTTAINTPAAGGYNGDIAAPDTPLEANPAQTAADFFKSIFTSNAQPDHTFGYNNGPAADAFLQIGKLGGPRRKRKDRAKGRVQKSAFLRAAHGRACSIFGTVLGPDANYAHRHHFHVDLQQRKQGSYCR